MSPVLGFLVNTCWYVWDSAFASIALPLFGLVTIAAVNAKIDVIPNNNVDGEDDQDLAIVVLSISTGSVPMYIALITTIMAILGTGFYLIYKYVVKK